MIVQTTMTRGECFLIKEQLPIWSKYADAFVFYLYGVEDDTEEYLQANKEKYNIVSILKYDDSLGDEKLSYETDHRQKMYDEALKYSKKIICLDTDEYLDGSISKNELEEILDKNPDTVFNLQWVQYASKDTIRVDTQWANNYKVRMGHYSKREDLGHYLRHSLHIPHAGNTINVNPQTLFIAHLQWLSKRWVGVKQYYWKVTDYISQQVHNEDNVYPPSAYDASVNNFNWQYAKAPLEMKIPEDIFDSQDMMQNYKLKLIVEYIKKYNIPNLGDWGMGIHEYAINGRKEK